MSHRQHQSLCNIAAVTREHQCIALDTRSGTMLFHNERPFPFLGVRLGPSVAAIATPLDTPEEAGQTPALAIDRQGHAIVACERAEPLTVDDPLSPVLDTMRRCLGLATKPCSRPVSDLVHAIWAERMLQAALDAPLGSPPLWGALSALHPLRTPGTGVSPELLAHRTAVLGLDWNRLRRHLIEGRVRWASVSQGLAAWFDSGSLARHLLGSLPEAALVLADLSELLHCDDSQRVSRTVQLR